MFLAHFSFDRDNTRNDDSVIGFFTTVVEATNVDDALHKCEELILNIRETEGMFSGVREIFLESIIEIRNVPPGGFLAHFAEWHGRSSISTTIRGADDSQAVAYGYDDEDSDHGEVTAFLTFDP